MVLGLGLAFLFIPLSLIAYSYLPPEKNNKASSLTNLFRNLGGSFGVAFVATMLARRSQFHQSVLSSHISVYNPVSTESFRNLVGKLTEAGMPSGEAATRAQAMIYSTVLRQSSLLAFLDIFWLLCIMALTATPLVLLIKKIRRSGPTQVGH